MTQARPKWFVSHDLDGFFGLAIDNLVQLIVIVGLCTTVCGMPKELIFGRILPGAAVSVVVGNLFYAWQARRLMVRTGRTDVTALPYGINTPSVFAYIFLVIAPAYHASGSAEFAWKVGLVACLGSGVIEFGGAFVAEWIRKRTPRAALLSTLAGIAVTFISMEFALQIFEKPLIAFAPLGILLLQYLTGLRYPYGIPGGLLAVLVGTLLAWGAGLFGPPIMDASRIAPALEELSLHPPVLTIGSWWDAIQESWTYLSVILPMGLFNVIGSLQNIESAEAAGDTYSARSSLAVNGVATLLAAAFGSCFPTTIYIGHPGWKRMGARAGYSIYNALFISAICFLGAMPLVLALVPIQAGVAVVLWIGIIITAQAFLATPKEHAPAVAIGLFPAVAAWGFLVINNTLGVSGKRLEDMIPGFEAGGTHITGLIALNQGFILSCMIWAAAVVALIEKHFQVAAVWMGVAAVLSALGLIHSYQMIDGSVANRFGLWSAPQFIWAYLLVAVIFAAFGRWLKRHPQESAGGVELGRGGSERSVVFNGHMLCRFWNLPLVLDCLKILLNLL
jgi:AGZA family xanthine/uracil permease-like MFS transporter